MICSKPSCPDLRSTYRRIHVQFSTQARDCPATQYTTVFEKMFAAQARSSIWDKGQLPPPPPDGCFAPPNIPLAIFLHINFPSPVSLDAQM